MSAPKAKYTVVWTECGEPQNRHYEKLFHTMEDAQAFAAHLSRTARLIDLLSGPEVTATA